MSCTLRDRNALIDSTVATIRLAHPFLSNDATFEVAATSLALHHGLVVTPEEIERVLSQIAEPLK